MDPATALAVGSAASGFGSGFFAPEGQEISPFTGPSVATNDPFTGQRRLVEVTPRETLGEALGLARSVLEQVGQRAAQPVSRAGSLPSSFVQNPATFSGGGLPFDIGVTAFDAANPFHEPTAPPGGFSGAAQAFLQGFQGGGGGGGGGGGFSLGDPSSRGGSDEGDFPDPGPPPNPPTFDQFPDDPRPPIIPGPPADPFPDPGPLPPPVTPPGGGGGDDDGGDDRPTDPGEVLPPWAFEPPVPPGDVSDDILDWRIKPSMQQQSPMGGFQAGFQQGQGNDFMRALEMLGAPMDRLRRRQ